MKKGTIVATLIIILIGVLAVSGYLLLNSYTQKRAKQEIQQMLKKANLEHNITYKSLKAQIFSKSITIYGINWNIEKHNRTVGKLTIDKVIISGNPQKDYKIKFNKAILKNLNPKAPKEFMGKIVLTIKNGFWITKHNNGRTTTYFKIEKIKFSKDFIKNLKKENKTAREIFNHVIKIENPISIQGKSKINRKNGTAKISNYSLTWKNNMIFSYSLKLSNIQFGKIKEITKNINSQKNNPTALIGLLAVLSQIKLQSLKATLIDKGLFRRVIDFIAKNDNITRQQVVGQLDQDLLAMHLDKYYQPISNFISGNKKSLSITIKNGQNLSFGQLMQKSNSSNLEKVLKITIKND